VPRDSRRIRVELTGDLIAAIGLAEAEIKAAILVAETVRARVHDGMLLRIEIDPPSLSRLLSTDARILLDLAAKIKRLGFRR